MKIVSKSDIGRVRRTNQDSYAAGEIRGAAWAVVCDGMGGANGGNIASAKAVKTISDCITNAYHPDMGANGITAMLESSIVAANLNIYDEAYGNEDLEGMGTTVVAVIVVNSYAYIAHAGDSRAYLISSFGVKQLTHDHSVVQNMVDKGELTSVQAERDPRKHMITRALGVSQTVEVEFTEAELADNDTLLICTDGLSNNVSRSLMCEIINNDYDNSPQLLIDAANNSGGTDNITAVLIKNA